jgi:hypothetical protein
LTSPDGTLFEDEQKNIARIVSFLGGLDDCAGDRGGLGGCALDA